LNNDKLAIPFIHCTEPTALPKQLLDDPSWKANEKEVHSG